MLERGWLRRQAREINADAEKWPAWIKQAAKATEGHHSDEGAHPDSRSRNEERQQETKSK